MRTVTSRQNPLVRACRALADDPPADGARVLLDGAHLVRDAVAAGLEIELVLVAASRLQGRSEEAALARELDRPPTDVVEVTDSVVAAASPVRTPSGIVAIARRTQLASAADVFGHPQAFVMAAVDVQDPGNVGALVRVAEAGGATAVCLSGGCANPFSCRALRGSMGSALRLPVVAGLASSDALDQMHAAGLRTVAAVPRGGPDPDEADWRGRTALVLGGEGRGLAPDLVARCDARVTIPMTPPVESLNIAAAAAILVYAARRQRT
jgi:TrmH family RNA methyltransferase